MNRSARPIRSDLSLIAHRYVIGQMIKRDILLRYRGAMFGVLWIFLYPLLMLAIFAFVFGQVFQSRWAHGDQADIPFWLFLYSGLISFNVFAESVSRAPTVVRGQPNLVKKIIFPVQVLPLIPLGTALVHAAFNLLVLAGALALFGRLSTQLALYPVVLLPLLLTSMGLSWFLAAWGVFLKDMNQIVPPFVQMTMFLSPIFYPASAVPEIVRPIYHGNPLGATIEACRAIALGQSIAWNEWLLALLAGAVVAYLGFRFFLHSREEFADAL